MSVDPDPDWVSFEEIRAVSPIRYHAKTYAGIALVGLALLVLILTLT